MVSLPLGQDLTDAGVRCAAWRVLRRDSESLISYLSRIETGGFNRICDSMRLARIN